MEQNIYLYTNYSVKIKWRVSIALENVEYFIIIIHLLHVSNFYYYYTSDLLRVRCIILPLKCDLSYSGRIRIL